MIAAITQIALMNENFRCRKPLGDFYGIVRAGVVNQDYLVDNTLRHDFIVRFDNGFFGIIAGITTTTFLP